MKRLAAVKIVEISVRLTEITRHWIIQSEQLKRIDSGF